MFAAARPRNIDLRPTARTDIALRGWAGRTRPSAAYSRRSSSRRTVSGGALSPSGRQLSRNLKYIVGIRIPEFESYLPRSRVSAVRIRPLRGLRSRLRRPVPPVHQRQDRGVSTVRGHRLHRDIKSFAERLIAIVQPQLRPDLSRAQFKTSLPCAFCELLRVPAMFGGLVSPDLSGQSAGWRGTRGRRPTGLFSLRSAELIQGFLMQDPNLSQVSLRFFNVMPTASSSARTAISRA